MALFRMDWRKILAHILHGWRWRIGRFTFTFMPARWYLGPGAAFAYITLSLGPIQIFFYWGDWIGKALDLSGEEV